MVSASYFNGTTSQRHAVVVELRDRRWLVTGDFVSRSEHVDAVLVSSALGATPRFVRFADGAVCEISDAGALAAMLASADIPDDRIGSAIMKPRLIAAIVVAFVALLFVTYRFGVPAAANQVADRAPDAAIRRLGTTTLQTLDATVLKPSALSVERRSALISAFAELRLPGVTDVNRSPLLFRKSDAIGANALTLPNGTIVVTDELVALAKNDHEILGVLAHEAGHAQRRHALRIMLESSAVSALLSWYVGDVNTLAVTAPASLLNASYSRDFEREADEFAIAVMQANSIPTSALADILERMAKSAGGGDGPAYFSTHPGNDERAARFRR
jgi:Zn-dependent protease with chaperone function